jgi:hypothetical protein
VKPCRKVLGPSDMSRLGRSIRGDIEVSVDWAEFLETGNISFDITFDLDDVDPYVSSYDLL